MKLRLIRQEVFLAIHALGRCIYTAAPKIKIDEEGSRLRLRGKLPLLGGFHRFLGEVPARTGGLEFCCDHFPRWTYIHVYADFDCPMDRIPGAFGDIGNYPPGYFAAHRGCIARRTGRGIWFTNRRFWPSRGFVIYYGRRCRIGIRRLSIIPTRMDQREDHYDCYHDPCNRDHGRPIHARR